MFEVNPDTSQISKAIRRLASIRTVTASRIESKITALARKQVADNFNARRAGDGPGWARLKQFTIEQKREKGYPADPLEATGALRRAVTGSGLVGVVKDNRIIERITDPVLAKRAAYLQLGTKYMPGRPFMALSVSFSKAAVQVLATEQAADLQKTFNS